MTSSPRLLALAFLSSTIATASCGPGAPMPVGPRTLWLDVPKDGFVDLVDKEPPVF